MNRALLISHFEEENKRRLQEEAEKLKSPVVEDLPVVEEVLSSSEVEEVDLKKKSPTNVKSKTP